MSIGLIRSGGDVLLPHWTICLIGLQFDCSTRNVLNILIHWYWFLCLGLGLRPASYSGEEVEEECSQYSSNGEGDHNAWHSCDGCNCCCAELLLLASATSSGL